MNERDGRIGPPDLVLMLTDPERAPPAYETAAIRHWRRENLPAHTRPMSGKFQSELVRSKRFPRVAPDTGRPARSAVKNQTGVTALAIERSTVPR